MLNEIVPLSPVHFFAFTIDCHYYSGKKGSVLPKAYLLPDLSSLHGRRAFADVALGWNEEGLFFSAEVNVPIKDVRFPDYTFGDAIELFFDTRDVKTTGYNTRFSHHFYLLPESIEEEEEKIPQAAEVTKFRTEDVHELCDSSKLLVKSEKKRDRYTVALFIPADCLHGYDPQQFPRLGFTYQIYRKDGDPQEFSASSEDFSFEQQPSLWVSLRLVKHD